MSKRSLSCALPPSASCSENSVILHDVLGRTLINWSGANQKYDQGTITFTSGINAGVSATAKHAISGVSVALGYPLLNAPAAGDAFTIYQGCDHTQYTCQYKFFNLENFRGFPYVPQTTYGV